MKILLTLLFCSLHAFGQNVYTMKDLRILYKQNDYKEYFDHAKDVIPSSRDSEWQEMTSKLGIKYLETLSKKQTPLSTKEQLLIDKISRWTIFKDDETFNNAKRPILIGVINKCLSLKNSNNCLAMAKQIFIKDSDPAFGIKILKILNLNRNIEYSAKDLQVFILPMLSSNICSFYINKEPLKSTVDTLFESDTSFFAKNEIEKDCKQALVKELKAKLYTTKSNLIRKNIKFTLRKWGKIHSNDIYFYNMAQFLSDYKFSKEELFTKWKTFKTLGKDVRIRNIILDKLFKIRPLYGKILYNESTEARAIISAIERYTPEYFSKYASLCLDYYTGKVQAPSGDCHQLFKRNAQLSLFSKEKSDKYKTIMNSWNKKINKASE